MGEERRRDYVYVWWFIDARLEFERLDLSRWTMRSVKTDGYGRERILLSPGKTWSAYRWESDDLDMSQ